MMFISLNQPMLQDIVKSYDQVFSAVPNEYMEYLRIIQHAQTSRLSLLQPDTSFKLSIHFFEALLRVTRETIEAEAFSQARDVDLEDLVESIRRVDAWEKTVRRILKPAMKDAYKQHDQDISQKMRDYQVEKAQQIYALARLKRHMEENKELERSQQCERAIHELLVLRACPFWGLMGISQMVDLNRREVDFRIQQHQTQAMQIHDNMTHSDDYAKLRVLIPPVSPYGRSFGRRDSDARRLGLIATPRSRGDSMASHDDCTVFQGFSLYSNYGGNTPRGSEDFVTPRGSFAEEERCIPGEVSSPIETMNSAEPVQPWVASTYVGELQSGWDEVFLSRKREELAAMRVSEEELEQADSAAAHLSSIRPLLMSSPGLNQQLTQEFDFASHVMDPLLKAVTLPVYEDKIESDQALRRSSFSQNPTESDESEGWCYESKQVVNAFIDPDFYRTPVSPETMIKNEYGLQRTLYQGLRELGQEGVCQPHFQKQRRIHFEAFLRSHMRETVEQYRRKHCFAWMNRHYRVLSNAVSARAGTAGSLLTAVFQVLQSQSGDWDLGSLKQVLAQSLEITSGGTPVTQDHLTAWMTTRVPVDAEVRPVQDAALTLVFPLLSAFRGGKKCALILDAIVGNCQMPLLESALNYKRMWFRGIARSASLFKTMLGIQPSAEHLAIAK